MFSPFDLPKGILLLITDELSSPAEFALHHCLISHIKEQTNSLNIVLSISEDLTKWQSVSAKSNVNLSQQISAETFHFINVSLALENVKVAATPFYALYEQIASVFEKASPERSALVILDDISALEWMGYSISDLFRFCRALRALCLKNQATLLIRHHIVTPGELDPLFRHLHSLCTYHLEVQPLNSGRSGAVSGQIALHPGPTAPSPSTTKLRSRSAALQYRLTDSSAVFFERGTSRGVL
ncbi:hypothetical protein GYMLUDRAFT_162044 [Collybiopsis luxurians FD-317 M1]|uniref:Elongator complex protein 5 n=1 Tax=Collybiopsis luxurians FD-317 M1 TaxID=944289 RepID=A0A0D0C7I4_9AGAR|nr:hypothetical protein GYMLUDRAFT_162044 [Collybiopsis luxurians FD-317 M1]